jgi:hypothetical protein
MTGLSTAAWVAHDLGLATGVGGSLFGRIAMHPAVRHVSDAEERGQVVQDAWKSFNVVQLASLAIMGASWFAGRSKLTGHEVDGASRALVLTKDALVVGTLATAIGCGIAGRALAAQAPGGRVPVDEKGEATTTAAPETARRLQRVVDLLGTANLLFGAGVLGVTTVLAMRAGKSPRWSFIARLLP